MAIVTVLKIEQPVFIFLFLVSWNQDFPLSSLGKRQYVLTAPQK